MGTMIVAECAKEHGGDLNKAKEMIRKAKNCGFNYVKFQAYSLDDINKKHPNYKRYVKCWLSLDQLKELHSYSCDINIGFFCSVFSMSLIPELAKFTSIIKVPSTFLSNEAFVKNCIKHFKNIHIATGMNSLDDIISYMSIYNTYNIAQRNIVYYHCISEYPTDIKKAKLSRIIKHNFRGYSDHTVGLRCMTFSYLLGIDWIEKHFTLNLNGSSWCVNEIDMIKFHRLIDNINEYLHDDEVVSNETKDNKKFFSTEFKDLMEGKNEEG